MLGKINRHGISFFGLKAGFGHGQNIALDTKRGSDTTTWRAGIVVGRKQFYKIADKFYLASTAILNLGVGEEDYRTNGTYYQPNLAQQYDLDIWFANLAIYPLSVCYKLSRSTMLELNLFSSSLGYESKKGKRMGYDNKIDRSSFELRNSFFSTIQISFIHRIAVSKSPF